jgi:hypothetical protein
MESPIQLPRSNNSKNSGCVENLEEGMFVVKLKSIVIFHLTNGK